MDKLTRLLKTADVRVRQCHVAPGHFDGMLNEGRADFVEKINGVQAALAAQQEVLSAIVEELARLKTT